MSFVGTLSESGYTPPGGLTVTWTHPSSPERESRRLDASVEIDSNFDLLDRYGEGDESLVGWQTVPAVSAEHSGGEIYPLVEELFKREGLDRVPTATEWVDFAFANFPGKSFVTVEDARKILPDYRQEPSEPSDCEKQLELAKSEIQAKERALTILRSQNDALLEQVDSLEDAIRDKLPLPAEHRDTLEEVFQWTTLGPGRHARIRRLKRFIYEHFS